MTGLPIYYFYMHHVTSAEEESDDLPFAGASVRGTNKKRQEIQANSEENPPTPT